MPHWQIQRLVKQHDRSPFDCGNGILNDWLKLRAGQFDRRDFSRTYVATHPDEYRVFGYYAISNHMVEHTVLPSSESAGLPKIDVPVALIGRLAVDQSVKGKGLGSILLFDALQRAQLVAEQIGIRAVEVDAIDDDARSFYLRFGFVPLLDDDRHLILPMHVVRRMSDRK